MSHRMDNVLARLAHARVTRHGAMARCPAHDDRNPSLSVRETPDGRVLIHCFARCPISSALAALGLTPADLRPYTCREVKR